jgi:hypothetical protein
MASVADCTRGDLALLVVASEFATSIHQTFLRPHFVSGAEGANRRRRRLTDRRTRRSTRERSAESSPASSRGRALFSLENLEAAGVALRRSIFSGKNFMFWVVFAP